MSTSVILESPESINSRIIELEQTDKELSNRLMELAEAVALAGVSKDEKKLDKLRSEQAKIRQEKIDIESQIEILNRRYSTAVDEYRIQLKVQHRSRYEPLLEEFKQADIELQEAYEEAQVAGLIIHDAGKNFEEKSRKATGLQNLIGQVAAQFGLEPARLSTGSNWISVDVFGVPMQELLSNMVFTSGRERKRKPFHNSDTIDSQLQRGK